MVAAGMARAANAERLYQILTGDLVGQELFPIRPRAVVRHGQARGMALGGNLSMLIALLGTPFEPRFEDAVLFLEDLGEPLYRLDRMLTQLRCSGRLRGVKALIGGSLRSCSPAASRDRRWRELLLEAAPKDAVVVVGLPFGHGAANMAFPMGVPVEVDTRTGTVSWSD
jgi:muramoyltetrapeptide carboxypeptidase